jgi:hypothetical protein
MTRNEIHRRKTRAALASANRLIGADTTHPSRAPAPLAAPEWHVSPTDDPRPAISHHVTEKPADQGLSHHVTKKPRGRPKGGVSQAARDCGLPEATYRRRLLQAGVRGNPDVAAAIKAAPVELSAAAILRISRHATGKAMLAAVDDEVAARIAPRPPSELERLRDEVGILRRRVAELEAGNVKPRPPQPDPSAAAAAKQAQLKILSDKQAARGAASVALAIHLSRDGEKNR